MQTRVVILGAGFGGLELSIMLSEALGERAGVTLIDKADSFVFGYSKLDVMFGRTTAEAVRLPYREIAMPGVRFVRQTVTAIDPQARRVSTDVGVHEADVLVVALGVGYNMDATPGLAEGANEFYSLAGATRLAAIIPRFSRGHAVIGVCGAPFKCPPAPSECALLLDDALRTRGVRDACSISFVIPLGTPVPPSPETSVAFVGSVDIDFLSGPTRTGTLKAPTAALVAEKGRFGSTRRARWFDADQRELARSRSREAAISRRASSRERQPAIVTSLPSRSL